MALTRNETYNLPMRELQAVPDARGGCHCPQFLEQRFCVAGRRIVQALLHVGLPSPQLQAALSPELRISGVLC